MKLRSSPRSMVPILAALGLGASATLAQSPMPAPTSGASAGVMPSPAVARGGARGGLPNATPEQTQAVADMNAALADLVAAVTKARNELAALTFAEKKDDAAIRAKIELIGAAEYNLAAKRAEEFAKIQAGAHRLSTEQVAALVMGGGNVTLFMGGGGARSGGGGGGRGGARGQ